MSTPARGCTSACASCGTLADCWAAVDGPPDHDDGYTKADQDRILDGRAADMVYGREW